MFGAFFDVVLDYTKHLLFICVITHIFNGVLCGNFYNFSPDLLEDPRQGIALEE